MTSSNTEAPQNTFEYGAAFPEDLWITGLDGEGEIPKNQFVDPRLRMPVDEDMAKDLDLNGQDTDVVVFRDSKNKGRLTIDQGRRRTRAARLVNILRAAGQAPSGKTEPLVLRYRVVTKGTSMKERVGAMFAENELRENDNAAVKAEKMAWFLKQFGDTPDNRAFLCTRMGITERRFNELMTLREAAPEAIYEAAKRGPDAPGGMGVEAAIAALDLPEERQAEIAEQIQTEVVETAKEEKAAKEEKRAPVVPASVKKGQKERSADKIREEARVAKANKKATTKAAKKGEPAPAPRYERPSSSLRKKWFEDIKFHNKNFKKAGEGPIEVDAAKLLGWLAGTERNPLEKVFKDRGVFFSFAE